MLKNLHGIDHAVIPVDELEHAALAWRGAGFTLAARGQHSPHKGTANYTIVFRDDYIELIGVERPTEYNRRTVAFLQSRQGIERVGFCTDDADALRGELVSSGLDVAEPLAFGRPVTLPGGGLVEAGFRTVSWPATCAPAGVTIFACEHQTPNAVWVPAWQQHSNGATGIASVVLVCADPRQEAEHLCRATGLQPLAIRDGVRVLSAPGRAAWEFVKPEAFASRYPAAVRGEEIATGGVAITLHCADLEQAKKQRGAVAHGPMVSLPRADTSGVLLSFVAD